MFTVRNGADGVAFQIDEYGVDVLYGTSYGSEFVDGLSATIHLDYGEARELAEALLAALQDELDI